MIRYRPQYNQQTIDLLALQEDVSKENKITYYRDEVLMLEFENLVKACQPNLNAQFNPYSLYNKEGQVYALIYVDYMESEGILDTEVDEKSRIDTMFVHNALKASDLKIDYLFVMPYYDYIDRIKGSFLSEVIVTKDM